MLLTIAILVALTTAAAAFLLAPRLSEGRVIFDKRPDRPSAFGFKMAWLAIRTGDTGRVIEVLGLGRPQGCNWRSGIGTVYDDRLGETHVFVSPPVNGWTFVVGLPLPYPVGSNFVDKCTPALLDLGTAFIEVQYFFTYPPIDFYAWARVIDGELVRAFAIGDEGVIWNKGAPTREEQALGLQLFGLRGLCGHEGDAGDELMLYPSEEHVMRLASCWSLDPTKLDLASIGSATGHIGLAPAAWRPERHPKTI